MGEQVPYARAATLIRRIGVDKASGDTMVLAKGPDGTDIRMVNDGQTGWVVVSRIDDAEKAFTMQPHETYDTSLNGIEKAATQAYAKSMQLRGFDGFTEIARGPVMPKPFGSMSISPKF